MEIGLLRQLGNISQIAGVREAVLAGGKAGGLRVAEFYNAAGLRFTVCPDRCMDLLDYSYKGVNFSFVTKNGPVAGAFVSPLPQEFCDQWSGGMVVTCGLDNVGVGGDDGAICPTHGRISTIPAEHFGTSAAWEGEEYLLRAQGEIHQTRLYGRHLLLQRTVCTTLYGKSVRIHDTVTNMEPADEPFELLYHCNFGYPMLTEKSLVYTSDCETKAGNAMSTDQMHMMAPVDGRGEEMYYHTPKTDPAWGAIVNPELGLGGYVRFGSKNLPFMAQWKNMRSHDYVLAMEPCNCRGRGRAAETKSGEIAVLPAYSSLSYDLEIGALDGQEEIDAFLKNL